MNRVVFTRKWPGDAVSLLEDAGFEVVERSQFEAPTEEELIDIVSSGPIAIITTVEDPVTDRVVHAASDGFRIVAQAGVGYDNVQFRTAAAKGIWTSNTPGVLDEATADLAFALLCASARQIPQSDRYVREGSWSCWHPSLFLGPELYEATVGIIGFGRIGQAFAKRCAGFGMKILYNATAPKDSAIPGTSFVALDELLTSSDIVSLHVPLNSETNRMIGERELELMKRTSILVNTARGKVVDTDALVVAMESRSIGAAALDVTDPEPLPAGHPLLRFENVIVTPHIGSASFKARTKMAEMAARNVIAAARGDVPPNAVTQLSR